MSLAPAIDQDDILDILEEIHTGALAVRMINDPQNKAMPEHVKDSTIAWALDRIMAQVEELQIDARSFFAHIGLQVKP